jgi:hypothetical protein
MRSIAQNCRDSPISLRRCHRPVRHRASPSNPPDEGTNTHTFDIMEGQNQLEANSLVVA